MLTMLSAINGQNCVVEIEDNCPTGEQPEDLDFGMLYGERLMQLLEEAEADGVIITVERRPLKPLAMRNAVTVGNVRGKR